MAERDADLWLNRERMLRRAAVCLAAGLLLDFLLFLIGKHFYFPQFLDTILNLPAHIYCAYLSAHESFQTDESDILENLRPMECYFIGFILNIPYYALLTYGGWRLWESSDNENSINEA